MTEHAWGATPAEWAHWTLVTGLGQDLLPVVSNPNARISPRSTLKTLGKVPSRYDGSGLVVGIANWTKLLANDAQISQWERNSDYGILMQTRHVRAIDVDCDDLARSGAIRARIAQMLGVFPCRGRAGSSRVAVGFTYRGEGLGKRVIKLPGGGAIELLADGQQFVVGGTHPSGGRYFWEGGLPSEFPTIERSALDVCWAALEQEFGDGTGVAAGLETQRGERDRRAIGLGEGGAGGSQTLTDDPAGRPAVSRPKDPVAGWLRARGWVKGISRDGDKLWVSCPWEDWHTADTGESATAWLLAGTGGYVNGHFECKHAHCTGRSDDQFLQAVGFAQSLVGEFEVVANEIGTALYGGQVAEACDVDPTAGWMSDEPGAGLTRTKKGWQATMVNLVRALQTPGWWRMVAYDTFKDAMLWRDWSDEGGAGVWHEWQDTDLTAARIALEIAGFEPMGKEMLRDAVRMVAKKNVFDLAQTWLGGQRWDGVERVGGFFVWALGCADTPYARACGEYLWTALAGRVLVPGVKADMAPILVAEQGSGKSGVPEALAPMPDMYTTMDFAEKDADLGRRMRGRVVAELGELRGLHSRDLRAVKTFMTVREDSWVPKFVEFGTSRPRRFVMIGTTDTDDGFLADDSGNRRWLPIRIGQADIAGIVAAREQLWAEGAALFKQKGVAWKAAEDLAKEEHGDFLITDDWDSLVDKWLDSEREDVDTKGEKLFWKNSKFTSYDVLVGALGLSTKELGRLQSLRVAKILRQRKYKIVVFKDENRKSVKRWYLSTLST